MLRNRIVRIAAAIAFAVAFMGAGAGIALAVVQPHMINARNDLKSALYELNAASTDKGGYRDQAINSVNNALRYTNLGIQYANNNS